MRDLAAAGRTTRATAMDKTRASLRRARVYAAVLLVCAIYATVPQPHRETLRGTIRAAAGDAIGWAQDHLRRGPR